MLLRLPHVRRHQWTIRRRPYRAGALQRRFTKDVVADESHAVIVPEGFLIEHTALVELLAVGVHVVQQSDLRIGDDVAVIGCGPIGLTTILAPQTQGTGHSFASASRDSRRDIARTVGADGVIDLYVTDPVEFVHSRTDDGVDIAFNVAGSGAR